MTLAKESDDFFTVAASEEFQDDPYPWYHLLRADDPVHETPFGIWLLTRHADVAAVVRDARLSNDPTKADLVHALREVPSGATTSTRA